MTEEEAKQAINAAVDARTKACVEKLTTLLDEHRCVLVPVVVIVADKIETRVEVRPK